MSPESLPKYVACAALCASNFPESNAISCIIFGIFMWRVNYDILMTYGMQEHAMWASVLNYWVPYVMIVMSYIIMNREPDYKA